jgi:hypothetical protein
MTRGGRQEEGCFRRNNKESNKVEQKFEHQSPILTAMHCVMVDAVVATLNMQGKTVATSTSTSTSTSTLTPAARLVCVATMRCKDVLPPTLARGLDNATK